MHERNNAMTEARFAELLAAYGADAARWPAAEREAAAAFAAQFPERAAALAAPEAALDALLALDERSASPSAALEARILAQAPRGAGVVVPLQRRRVAGQDVRMLAALAACAVLGVALGFTGAPAGDDSLADADAAFGAAFGVMADPGEGG